VLVQNQQLSRSSEPNHIKYWAQLFNSLIHLLFIIILFKDVSNW
jgi:hypothetical protein